MRIMLLALLAVSLLHAQDNPIGLLADGEFRPSKVYEYVDAKTLRRWLVFEVSNGNGGFNIAIVEATLTAADRLRLNPPARPAAPAPKDTKSFWLYSKTYGGFSKEYQDAGWEFVSSGPGNPPGSIVTVLRRKNPDYVEPKDVEVEAVVPPVKP